MNVNMLLYWMYVVRLNAPQRKKHKTKTKHKTRKNSKQSTVHAASQGSGVYNHATNSNHLPSWLTGNVKKKRCQRLTTTMLLWKTDSKLCGSLSSSTRIWAVGKMGEINMQSFQQDLIVMITDLSLCFSVYICLRVCLSMSVCLFLCLSVCLLLSLSLSSPLLLHKTKTITLNPCMMNSNYVCCRVISR